MAKTKKNYSMYIIAGIVIILVAALVYYSGGEVGQATWRKAGLVGKRNQAVACYFQYPPGTTKEQMAVNICEGYGRKCDDADKKGYCEFGIYEKEGEEYTVSSTCAGTHRVRNDGKRKELKFDCKPVDIAQVKIQQQTGQCSNYKATSQDLKNKITEARQRIDKLAREIQSLTEQITTYEKMLNENEQKVAVACALPVCGNNQVELGEECDSADRTKCTAACKKIIPVITLTDQQQWHVYQCLSPVYFGKDAQGTMKNVGPYFTALYGPPGCPSNAATIDYDLGYLLKQRTPDRASIKLCQHKYGRWTHEGITTETDIKYDSNCDYDDRQFLDYERDKVNEVTSVEYGFVFRAQQPGTRQAYKCVKSGTPLRYNYKISFSPNCNAGQPGWEGYQNVGTLGWWLIKPELPVGVMPVVQ